MLSKLYPKVFSERADALLKEVYPLSSPVSCTKVQLFVPHHSGCLAIMQLMCIG